MGILNNIQTALDTKDIEIDWDVIRSKPHHRLTQFEKACDAAISTWNDDFLEYLSQFPDFKNLVNQLHIVDDRCDQGEALHRIRERALTQWAEMNKKHFEPAQPTLQQMKDDNSLCDREAR